MPHKPFRLGGRVFESRAQELIGSILGSYGVGDRVSDEHGALLRDLIRLHPQADEKFGSDLSQFVVDINSESSHATPHFVAVHASDVASISATGTASIRRLRSTMPSVRCGTK
jgi:hypothetical protein